MDNNKQEIVFFEKMRSIRKNNDIELKEISDNTKINIKYLELIEKGDFDSLPNIYARLFIRTYADYLNLDSKEVLLEYDKYTNVKPNKLFQKKIKPIEFKEPKREIKTQPKLNFMDQEKKRKENILAEEKNKNLEEPNKEKENPKIQQKKKIKEIYKEPKIDLQKNRKKFDVNQKYFYSPANILKTVSSLLIIIIVYFLIVYLSREQSRNLESNQTNTTHEINTNLVTDNNKLNNDNFNQENFISSTSKKINKNINSPYVFQILTKKKTKLNISHDDNNGERIEDCNIIARKDSILKFVNEGNIYFDLWNSHHVDITINGTISIDEYLKEKNGLVRGEFDPSNKKLYLKFYNY